MLVTASREAQFVNPFYLRMMRTNAVDHGAELLPALVEASRSASAEDVVALLLAPWRSTVMGAWLSVTRSEESVTDAVLAALVRSHGSLDAPPLAVAAVVLAGDRAILALTEYARRDLSEGWGAAAFIAAAIEHLGGGLADALAGAVEQEQFAEMLRIAHCVRDNR